MLDALVELVSVVLVEVVILELLPMRPSHQAVVLRDYHIYWIPGANDDFPCSLGDVVWQGEGEVALADPDLVRDYFLPFEADLLQSQIQNVFQRNI